MTAFQMKRGLLTYFDVNLVSKSVILFSATCILMGVSVSILILNASLPSRWARGY